MPATFLLRRLGYRSLVPLTLFACRPAPAPLGQNGGLDPQRAAALADSARAFAESIALGVTARGPAGWNGYLADEPAFFMASEGRLVFPDKDSASRAIRTLASAIPHVELRWGASLRVDPLAPGLVLLAAPYHETRVDAKGHRVEEDGYFTGIAEHGAGGWRLRNAHWSVPVPPSAVP
jgi:hypothetical protein